MICSSFLIFVPKPRKNTVPIELPRNLTNQKQMVATNHPELSALTLPLLIPQRLANVLCVMRRSIHFYACPKFKPLPHEAKLSVLKNKLCSNCLGSGHFWRQFTSVHKCKVCQKPNHTLLHLDQPNISSTPTTVTTLAQSATTQD